jgi:hypothetical protein
MNVVGCQSGTPCWEICPITSPLLVKPLTRPREVTNITYVLEIRRALSPSSACGKGVRYQSHLVSVDARENIEEGVLLAY